MLTGFFNLLGLILLIWFFAKVYKYGSLLVKGYWRDRNKPYKRPDPPSMGLLYGGGSNVSDENDVANHYPDSLPSGYFSETKGASGGRHTGYGKPAHSGGGYAMEMTGPFGDKRIDYFKPDHSPDGYSMSRQTSGGERIEYFKSDHSPDGYSEKRIDMSGKEYWVRYNSDGTKCKD